jgi:hypothetical protein
MIGTQNSPGVWTELYAESGRNRTNGLWSAPHALVYYHRSRPHQGKESHLLVKPKLKKQRKAKPLDTISLNEIRCEQKLGGLLKTYKWAA